MTLKGLAFLRDPARSFGLTREPAWPQDRVVEIGLLDQGRRVPVRIKDAADFSPGTSP